MESIKTHKVYDECGNAVFVGSHAECVEFVNTVSQHKDGKSYEILLSSQDIVVQKSHLNTYVFTCNDGEYFQAGFTVQAETVEMAVQKLRCANLNQTEYNYLKGDIQKSEEDWTLGETHKHYTVGSYEVIEIKPNDLLVYKHL